MICHKHVMFLMAMHDKDKNGHNKKGHTFFFLWPIIIIKSHIRPISSNFLFNNIFLWPKWQWSIGRCRNTGNHPRKDLATSSYKPNIKIKSLIHLVFLWLHVKNQIKKIWIFSPPHFWWLKPSEIISFYKFINLFLARFFQ